MKEEDALKLLRLLSPEALKENLVKASAYLIAFELLEDMLIEWPRGFFTEPTEDGRGLRRRGKAYGAEVRSNDRDVLVASCKWFEKHGGLTASEIEEIKAIREHRAKLAHEMLNVVLDPEKQVDEQKLVRIYELMHKVSVCWIEFHGWPPDSDVGAAGFLRYLIDVAFRPGRVM